MNYDLIKDFIDSFYNSEKRRTYTPENQHYYSFNNVYFDKNSRKAKVTYTEHNKYRTIERYVQRNYERFPIYSDWKIKSKTITKSVRLDNETIETLCIFPDFGISLFASLIIYELKDTSLIPSWFSKDAIMYYYNKLIKKQKNDISNIRTRYDDYLLKIAKPITKLKKNREKQRKKLKKYTTKIDKLYNTAIVKLELTKKINGIERKINKYEAKSHDIIQNLNKCKEIYSLIRSTRVTLESLLEKKNATILSLTDKERDLCLCVEKLPRSITQTDNFIKLKDFIGLNYTHITGCYVIRNDEKNKYYVGQSKDVVKRIKQHFSGTVPKNIIFAEDYYRSQNNDNLFSVKIHKLSTKDEMDAMEKYLIDYYDAYSQGYNKTQGNS